MIKNSLLLQPCKPGFTNLVHLEPHGGARRDRTADLLRARQALSQLSYGPMWFTFHAKSGAWNRSETQSKVRLNSRIEVPEFCRLVDRRSAAYLQYASCGDRLSCEILVGLGRFELPTSPLSGVRSNQLSYRPI